MPFNHNRKRGHDGQDSMWTSYSDLFLGLSVVFLLLYVTASLRQGTEGIRQHLDYQRLTKENEDIKQQLKVYSALKQDYMEKEASQDEQQNYKDLMDKLDLLQEQAKDEKNQLIKEASNNEKKEKALSKYQQMIRNIINTNMLAKSRIHSRDDMISDQGEEITDLEGSVKQKKAQLASSEVKIKGLEKNLDSKLKALKSAYHSNQITKKNFEARQKKLKTDAESQISNLKSQNSKVKTDIAKMNSELSNTKTALSKSENQNQQLSQNLKLTEAQYRGQVASMKSSFANQQAHDKADFDAAMAQEKLSSDAKAAREAQFRATAEKKAQGLSSQLAGLDAKYRATSAELATATENLNARKKVAARISENFRKNGIKADVDAKTGDVVLAFGNQYFDSDSANLKNGMKQILEHAVPVYSSSLFEDKKIADKIANVEIVGFASPTFQGRSIDPRSLNPGDRAAVNYNLDLSYNRARSIFNHIFDQNKMTFKYQQKLLPLVKVTGRSFLDQADRNPATDVPDSLCQKKDCAKLQRVIIKFNLKD